MLKGLADLLGRGEFVENRLVRNAVLESFLIHARALVEFFYWAIPGRRLHEDDAVAVDFLGESDREWWKTHINGDPKWYASVRERVNKGVAHISYQRGPKKAWDWSAIDQGISDVADEFLRRVPPEVLGGRWEVTKRNISAGQ